MKFNGLIGKSYYDELKKIAEGDMSKSNNFFVKALTNSASGSGSEFMPVKYSADIIRAVYERSWHRQVFNTYVMTTLSEKIPAFVDRWAANYQASPITSADPANQIALTSTSSSTSEREIALKTLTINLMIENKFLAYNANPQIEEIIKEDMVMAIMENEIDAIINGDDSTTHQDSDVTSASDVRKVFKGLRKLATATSVDVSGGAFTFALFNKMIRRLGRYARGKYDELVLITSPAVAEDIRTFSELTTIEKYGPNATVLKGEVGKLSQVTVVETDYIREDLNASGVYDGTTTNLTMALLCWGKDQFMGVPRFSDRALNIKRWDDPRFDRIQLIAKEDMGFQTRHTDSIVKAINISTA